MKQLTGIQFVLSQSRLQRRLKYSLLSGLQRSQNTFQEVEMVAENLGSIPPNTAMLLITAGDKTYRLYLTSTEEKNAMVRFVYDPPDPVKRNIL